MSTDRRTFLEASAGGALAVSGVTAAIAAPPALAGISPAKEAEVLAAWKAKRMAR